MAASPKEKARLKALRKKHGLGEFAPKGKSSSSKKKASNKGSTVSKPSGSSKSSSPKKMTIGKYLDLGSLGAAGIYEVSNYYETKDIETLKVHSILDYAAFNVNTGLIDTSFLVRGYGPVINRVAEKKVFKVLGVRGPRTRLSTVGDMLDHLTYFGPTAMKIYEHREHPERATAEAIVIQYGVNMRKTGMAAYDPIYMVKNKWGPYLLQKYARKFMRKAGINFGGLL